MFDRNLFKLPGMGAVMGALLLFALLQAAAVIGQALALSTCIDALWNGSALADQVPLVGAFFACFALHRLLVFAQDTMLDRFSQKSASALHGELLASVFAPHGIVHERGSASIAETATQGIDDVQKYLRIIPPKVVGMMAISIPILVCVFVHDWPSGVILAVMFPVIIFFMILLGRQARSRAERQYEAYHRLSNHFLDTLRGIGAIVASGATAATEDDVYESSEDLRRATVRTLSTATLSSAVLDLCATFGVGAVAIMLAFRLMDGSIALGAGLLVLILAPEYFSPIRAFASDYHASLDGKNALSAVLDIVGTSHETDDSNEDDKAPAPKPASSPEPEPASTPAPLPPGIALEFRTVSFRYPDAETDALRGIDLSVPAGKHVAVVGPSGSGKSTLAALAAGIVQPSGGLVRASRPVHFIPQQPYIFRASLLDNMRFYTPQATRADVERVVEVVGLESLVGELPEGLDSLVGEGNRGLSGGQAHRVALARMLLDESDRILVFDEPTAHLDIETELELKQRMLPLLEGRTVLFATHRLHWLADMDCACVLDHGAIAQFGPVAELAAEGGALSALMAHAGGGDAS